MKAFQQFMSVLTDPPTMKKRVERNFNFFGRYFIHMQEWFLKDSFSVGVANGSVSVFPL